MMPESMNIAGQTAAEDLRPPVEAFYEAMVARDGDRMAQIVDQHFAEGAVLHRPESLPGGGLTEGAGRIKRFMTAAAAMEGGPLDVATMNVARVIASPGTVAVELEFPFAGKPAGAMEVWTIQDSKVTSIKAYYWDTAAMIEAARG